MKKLQTYWYPLAFLLISACSGGGGASDVQEAVPDMAQEAAQLSQSLGDAAHPVNEELVLALLTDELGSAPFYLVDYVQLGDHEGAQQELDASVDGEAELLAPLGAQQVLSNLVFNVADSDDEISWTHHRVIYFPSPQAFADLISNPAYAELMVLKRSAATEIRTLWMNVQLTQEVIDLNPEKEEFYMLNLSKHREEALYPDGTSHGLTGKEASGVYGNIMLNEVLPSIGAYPILAGEITQLFMGEDGDWDNYATVYYPSIADLVAMTQSARFQEVSPNKWAGLEKNISMMSLATQEPPLVRVD